MQTVYDFTAQSSAGDPVPLSRFAGQALLIVNTASQCGFTPQYAGLEELYRLNKDRGFSVLAFPCNQFGGQEPGTSKEIAEFCESRFKVTFPVFQKVNVNGANEHPLFTFLKDQGRGVLGSRLIKWNFTKFLVNRNGHVLERFAPTVEPLSIASALKGIL